MTDGNLPQQFMQFAHQLLTAETGTTIEQGALVANPTSPDAWTISYVDGETPIYVDTVRPSRWGSAAELNIHLQSLAPIEVEEDAEASMELDEPTGAFQ